MKDIDELITYLDDQEKDIVIDKNITLNGPEVEMIIDALVFYKEMQVI